MRGIVVGDVGVVGVAGLVVLGVGATVPCGVGATVPCGVGASVLGAVGACPGAGVGAGVWLCAAIPMLIDSPAAKRNAVDIVAICRFIAVLPGSVGFNPRDSDARRMPVSKR